VWVSEPDDTTNHGFWGGGNGVGTSRFLGKLGWTGFGVRSSGFRRSASLAEVVNETPKRRIITGGSKSASEAIPFKIALRSRGAAPREAMQPVPYCHCKRNEQDK
jgi:hypothetical protein